MQGDGVDDKALAALKTLRHTIIPATVGKLDGADVGVTGNTAGQKDTNGQMKHAAPFVFAFVLTLAFLLMLVTFRSVVVATKAVLLNLLSVAAAYGALVLVFQNGWGKGLLGFVPPGGIISWLPIFLFVILFGLSMDYHVFILSRVREAFDRGMSTEEAVAHGIKTTAGVVTSAALVMFGVFAIFATLQFMFLKEFGVGLAIAVLVDATIVRAVLLPATMKLLGDWNWYLPKWLEWLPALDHGRSDESTAIETPVVIAPAIPQPLRRTGIFAEGRRRARLRRRSGCRPAQPPRQPHRQRHQRPRRSQHQDADAGKRSHSRRQRRQDVHRNGRPATRRSRQAPTHRHRRALAAGTRPARRQDQHPATAQPHEWARRL